MSSRQETHSLDKLVKCNEHLRVAHVVRDASSATSVMGVSSATEGLAGPSLLLLLWFDLSLRLKRALSPKDFLVEVFGLGGSSSAGDMEAYPESSDNRDEALPALSRERSYCRGSNPPLIRVCTLSASSLFFHIKTTYASPRLPRRSTNS
jgi:hypothetical protein